MNSELKHVLSAGIVGVGVALVAGVTETGNVDTAEAQYHTPWSRDDAYWMAYSGLNESYEYAASKRIDDNQWQNWPDEGADCSGYAGKAWAAPVYTAPGTDYNYSYTGTWYGGNVDGSMQIAINDSRTRKADAWVYRASYGGPGNHMGLYEGYQDANGKWKTMEAQSETWGIRYQYRPDSFMFDSNAKRFKRLNW